MSNALPQVLYGYSGGRKVVDNTVGKWKPLQLASGISGSVKYLLADGIMVLNGYINTSEKFRLLSDSIGPKVFDAPKGLKITGFPYNSPATALFNVGSEYYDVEYDIAISNNAFYMMHMVYYVGSSDWGKSIINPIQFTYTQS